MTNNLKSSLIAGVFRQYGKDIAWVFVFSLLVNLLTLTPTLYMMQIYDRILMGQSVMSLLIISLTVLCLFLLMTYADIIRSKILIILGNKIEVLFSDQLFAACLEVFLKNQNIEPAAYLRSLVEFKQFIAGMAIVYLFDVIWSPIYLIIAYLLHPLLAAVCVIVMLIQLFLLLLTHRITIQNAEKSLEIDQAHKQFTHNNLRNLLPIYAMGFADRFKAHWLMLHQQSQSIATTVRAKTLSVQSVVKYYRYSVQIISLGIGAYLAVHGQISIGSMIAANLIIARAIVPLDQLTQMWPQWIAFLKANSSLTTLFKQQPINHSSNQMATEPIYAIQAQHFSAKYDELQPEVIGDVSLSLKAGDVVAIVGQSGSGKTTLAKALMGLLPITTGQLSFNNQSANNHSATDINNDCIGGSTGYLPQDFQLFDGTVAENIARFGVLDSEEITKAAMTAGIHEWVLRLPKGYDTLIGYQGQELSGGQKQQLGLARAIYKNSSFVVLDEPNSNLDESGERALYQVLVTLKKNQAITLVITHREQVFAYVDKILWLERGRIKAFDDKEIVLPLLRTRGA